MTDLLERPIMTEDERPDDIEVVEELGPVGDIEDDLDEVARAIAACLAGETMPWDALISVQPEAAVVRQTIAFAQALGRLVADRLESAVSEDHLEVAQVPVLVERALRELFIPPAYAPLGTQIVALASEAALARLVEVVPL